MAPGMLICSREFRHLGSVSAINSCLGEMVHHGELNRVARGVFQKPGLNVPPPSVAAIAEAKARAYERIIAPITIFGQPSGGAVYATDGASTSYKTVAGEVRLKRAGPRKLSAGNTQHGLLMRSFWEMGKDRISKEFFKSEIASLARTEKAAYVASLKFQPAWLSDLYFRSRAKSLRAESEQLVHAGRSYKVPKRIAFDHIHTAFETISE